MLSWSETLRLFVSENQIPNFSEFISASHDDVVAWSLDHSSFTGSELYGLWKRRFALALKEGGKGSMICQSGSKYNKDEWEQIEALVKETRKTKTSTQRTLMGMLREAGPSTAAIINKTFTIPASASAQQSEQEQGQDQNQTQVQTQAQAQAQASEKEQEQQAEDLDGKGIEQLIHTAAYKKLSGSKLGVVEKNALARINGDMTIKGALYSLAAQALLKDELSILEECIIKLSLSCIVDLINPGIKNAIMGRLDQQQKVVLEAPRRDSKNEMLGLERESLEMFDQIVDVGDDVDDILSFIQVKKANLSAHKRRNSQLYAMLCVVEQVIENCTLWYKDCHESELTFYRRFAALLDIIFKGTPIELADGETGSASTRTAITMNKAVFQSNDISATYARKIDLLMKFDGSGSVELCSNEWKRSTVAEGTVTKQQCKNLRVNASILSVLMDSYGDKFNMIMAMDWIGNVGYMYSMERHDEVFVSRLHETMMIPNDVLNLPQFKSTLNNLFLFKNVMMDICQGLKKKQFELNAHKRLWNIVGNSPATGTSSPISPSISSWDPSPSPSSSSSSLSLSSSASTLSTPYIFFTPRANRVKKRTLIDMED